MLGKEGMYMTRKKWKRLTGGILLAAVCVLAPSGTGSVRAADESVLDPLVLTEDKVVSGNLQIMKNGSIDLNGHTLEVQGNLLQTIGVMNINGGSLIVNGDYRIQTTSDDTEDGYNWTKASLVMAKEEDSVLVKGGFYTSSEANDYAEPDNVYTAGTLEVKGNFMQICHIYGKKAFQAAGTQVILSGTDKQVVHFDNPHDSYFYDLVLKNSDVVVETPMSGWKLTEDLKFANGLPQGIYGTLDLNGHKMEVGGDMLLGDKDCSNFEIWGNLKVNEGELIIDGHLLQEAGVADIGGGLLSVGGDYRIQRRSSDSKDGYDWTKASLVMDGEEDVVQVDGSFYTSSEANDYDEPDNVFSAGVMDIGGDFRQVCHIYGKNAFPATGTQVCLRGEGQQRVSFENPYNSYFADLVLENENVIVESPMSGWKLSTDLVFGNGLPNGIYGNMNLAGHSMTVNGDMKLGDKDCGDFQICGNMSLAGGELKIAGNLLQENGTMEIGGGKMSVGGDYRIQKQSADSEDGYDWCKGSLVMTKDKDFVSIGGSFYTSSEANDYAEPDNLLTAGLIELAGDFSQVKHIYGAKAFPAAGTTVKLVGTEVQNIYFDSPYDSYFSNLTTTNPKVQFNSMIKGWKLTEDTVFGMGMDKGTCGSFDLNGKKLTITGNVTAGDSSCGDAEIFGNININGGALDISGHLLQEAGQMKLGGGKLSVGGDYRIQKRSNDTDDKYDWCRASLTMDNPADVLKIGGSFYTSSQANDYAEPDNVLTAGLIELAGDFYQIRHIYGSKAFPAEGTAVRLVGENVQKIYFEDPYKSYFSNLTTTNPNVSFESMIKGWTLTEDTTFGMGMEKGTCGSFDLNGKKLTITGNMVMGDTECGDFENFGSVNINGGTLSISGWLLQQAGEMKLAGGELSVGGDYRIQKRSADSEDGYDWCKGSLVMDNAADRVKVDGSFYTSSEANDYAEPDNVLTAGVMEINGNFYQIRHIYGSKAFPAKDSHKVIMKGEGNTVLNVSFENYPDSGFANLQLTRDPSYYKFTPETCWKNRMVGAVEEQPTSEQPTSEQPKTEQPTSEQPKIEQTTSEQPKTEQPKTEQPKTEQPKTEQPKTEQPKTEQPKTGQPASQFAITFDANGGTASTLLANIKAGNVYGTLPEAKRKGYEFKGWYTKKSGGVKVTEATVANANATVYAQWKKISVGKGKVTKVKAGSKSFTVTWKKISGVDGYCIKYSLKANMKGCKTKYVSDSSKSATIKGLKAKKKYYVEVCGYKLDAAGEKVIGKSNKKSVTTKK